MSSPIRRCAPPAIRPAFPQIDQSKGICAGLMDYWPMAENLGPVQSAGIPAMSGTLGATATWSNMAGRGRAINFGGAGTSSITTTGSLYNWERTQAWSVSLWMYGTVGSSTERTLLTTLDPATGFRGWEVSIETTGQPRAFIINSFPGNAFKSVSGTTLSSNTLYHLVFTYDGSSNGTGVTFYINGAPGSAPTVSPNVLSATSVSTVALRMGSRSNGTLPFTGTVADVGIWNRVLSASEVSQLFAQPLSIFRPFPTGWMFGDPGLPPAVTGPVLFYNHYLNQGWR